MNLSIKESLVEEPLPSGSYVFPLPFRKKRIQSIAVIKTRLQQVFGFSGKVKRKIRKVTIFTVSTLGKAEGVFRLMVCNIFLERNRLQSFYRIPQSDNFVSFCSLQHVLLPIQVAEPFDFHFTFPLTAVFQSPQEPERSAAFPRFRTTISFSYRLLRYTASDPPFSESPTLWCGRPNNHQYQVGR